MEFFLILQWSLTSLPTLIFLYNIFSKKLNSKPTYKAINPPEASGRWPVIGHLHLLAGRELPHHVLARLADKYGPIFMIKMGVYPELVVSNWELAKECFTTNDKIFITRPNNKAMRTLSYGTSIGFEPYGPLWIEMRKVSKSNLLSNQRVMLQKTIRAAEIDVCFRKLYQMYDENGKCGILVDMKKWSEEVMLNVVTRMVCGKKGFGTKAREGDGEAKRYKRVIDEAAHFIGNLVVSDLVPGLEWLDNLMGTESAMKKTAKEFDEILGGWVLDHRRRRKVVGVIGEGEKEDDFIDLTMDMVEETSLHGLEPDFFIKSLSAAMVLGGSDTTSVVLVWVLSLLVNNRNVLKKAQEELNLHVGKSRKVDDSDIPNLVYLQAIIKETMRLYQPGPLIEREATEDTKVGGYHVQAGTRILVNLWKLQRDPNLWPDPSEFCPERFLVNNMVDLKGQNFELMPFGCGRRMCPGVSFGLQVVSLVLARLIQGFEFATASDMKIDMVETSSVTNYIASAVEILLVPRLDPKLYDY